MAKEHELKTGVKVKYYPVMGRSDCTEHEVISECWNVCGSTVVKVSGVRGGVCIDHLEVVGN